MDKPTTDECDQQGDGVEDGKCRFNCRNAKENFLIGFRVGILHMAHIIDAELGSSPHPTEWSEGDDKIAEEAYHEWKRQQT